MQDHSKERAGARPAHIALVALALVALALLALPAAASAAGWVYQDQWGTSGPWAGQFSSSYIWGIASDGHGSMYVADAGNDRIQQFSKDGTLIRQWGGSGTDPGQLQDPAGVCVGPDGLVYVAEFYNNRVQVFDAEGSPVRMFGSAELSAPSGVALDSNGNVYVSEFYNHRVSKFDPEGNFVTSWGTGESAMGPWGIAVDEQDRVYVPAWSDGRIDVFDTDGNVLESWGTPGTDPGQLYYPCTVTIGPDENVYVGEYADGRVLEFTPDGDFITQFGGTGTGPGVFDEPVYGIAFDRAGRLYATDGWGTRVEVFAYDDVAPKVTTDADGEWHSEVVTVTASAEDALAGVDTIEYSWDGTDWYEGDACGVTAEPSTHGTDGVYTVRFRATDLAGNRSAPVKAYIRMDTRPPRTKLVVAPPAWSNGPVTLDFICTDTGAGVRDIWVLDNLSYYQVADGTYTVSDEGIHTMGYYADDLSDPMNWETQHDLTVGIDQTAPKPLALADATVVSGKSVKLKYQIGDNLSPTCSVKLVIKKKTKVVKTFTLGQKAVATPFAKSFTCTLPVGAYTWTVTGTDLAGNAATSPAKKLTVK
jgi:hypothetical protein